MVIEGQSARSLLSPFIHSQVFVEYLICARPLSRHYGYEHEQH